MINDYLQIIVDYTGLSVTNILLGVLLFLSVVFTSRKKA
jgi:hypothetical protein